MLTRTRAAYATSAVEISENPVQEFRPSGNYLGVMRDGQRRPGRASDGRDWSARLAVHARWLRTVILARSGDRSAIDEIFQEISLAAVRHGTMVPEEKVAPWLYRLAVRQSLLHRRRLGRQRRLRNGFARELPSDAADSADPLTWLLSDERRQLIRRAIGQLNSKDAELLLLKYTEDWSYHELAAHLGISHSAVETRLHRARQRLRAELVAVEVLEVTS